MISRRARPAALLALAALSACDGGRDEQPAAVVAAPDQAEARLALTRVLPGNPPRFAVMTIADDGSNWRVLVRAPSKSLERIGQVVWAPNGKRVYFVGVHGEQEGDGFVYYESDVFVVDANGGKAERVTTTRDVQALLPAPDGESLLIVRLAHPAQRPPFASSIWLTDSLGRSTRRLDTDNATIVQPGSWSPDGETVALTRCSIKPPRSNGFVENTCAVYTMSADGSNLRRLAEESSEPAFSPSGEQIAFVSDRDGHGEIARGSDENSFANELYVMDADGSNQRRLTETAELDEATPSWSPDGSRIAYAREGPARFRDQIMIVNADGSCATLVIGDAANHDVHTPSFNSPVWRPGRVTGSLAALDC